VRWWRYALGGALLAWVLGIAYFQARRRGRRMGLALFLFGAAAFFFAASILPQSTLTSQTMVISSIILLALSIAVALWRGFHR